PSVTSSEYLRNYGLAAIHADVAYALGATGSGITVAVIDTGVNPAQADLVGAVSSASVDILGSRSAPAGVDPHGERVAGVIAARFNGMGSIGVAYQSTILSIRADDTAGDAKSCDDKCNFRSSDLARAVDYAVANGARVINLSLGGDGPLSPTFEAALGRAAAAGVVIAASSGNDGLADPGWPGRYATDPRFQGAVLAVGALSKDGTLASFSNRAGVSANGYIAAPGEDVITGCEPGSCWRVAGTSFAAPHVAGALALLLQAFPNISGRDAVDILLRTAEDRGASGTDSLYGRGALDLTRAFAPVGTSSLPLAKGGATPVSSGGPGTTTGAAFGNALVRTDGLRTVIRDDYQRLFAINLADTLPARIGGGMARVQAPVQDSTRLVLASPQAPVAMAFQVEAPLFEAPLGERPVEALSAPRPMRSARVRANFGRFSLTSWRGEGDAPAPEGLAGRDAFQALARPDRMAEATLGVGRLTLAAEQGTATVRAPLQLTVLEASRYASASAALMLGRARLSATGGLLTEPLGPLGSYVAPGSTLESSARTRYGAAALDLRVSPRLAVRAEAAVGRTRADGAVLDLTEAVSSSWSLAATLDCAGLGWLCDQAGLEIAQPLRVERGRFQAYLADIPVAYDDPQTFSLRRISAAPDGREIDLHFSLQRTVGPGEWVVVRSGLALQPGHRADAAPELGASALWRRRF
ncbi:S8 family peptidase, partial [Caulobacter sp. HMWF025]|uniref:S8 family peptidase n=2 Tax=unclassified Caulobacter TaxID=2648921 RepID=UPI000D3CCD66